MVYWHLLAIWSVRIDNADLVCTLELSLVAINPARHSGHSGVVWFTFIA